MVSDGGWATKTVRGVILVLQSMEDEVEPWKALHTIDQDVEQGIPPTSTSGINLRKDRTVIKPAHIWARQLEKYQKNLKILQNQQRPIHL